MKIINSQEPKSIITVLKNKRLQIGYSQEYIASILKIEQSTYQKIESGNLKLKAELLIQLAKILDLDLNQFKD